MNDLTIIYYTDNSLPADFAEAVRGHLHNSADKAGQIPIVSVSQQSLSFGRNICVGEIGRSYRNIIEQICTGLEAAATPYVALCEHDVIYPPEHFALRPTAADEAVVFDQNRCRCMVDSYLWGLWRGGRSMQLVIGNREMLLENFRGKLTVCQENKDWRHAFEPGKGESKHGLPPLLWSYQYSTGAPIIEVCNHGGNYGPPKRQSGTLVETLEPWGKVKTFMRQFHIPAPAKLRIQESSRLPRDRVLAVTPVDDPSPVAYMNLYDPGDTWVKIQGCEACEPERAARCCGVRPNPTDDYNGCPFRGEFGCALHYERGPWKSKPYHCAVLPLPTTTKGKCALVYECTEGPNRGKKRHLVDVEGVLR